MKWVLLLLLLVGCASHLFPVVPPPRKLRVVSAKFGSVTLAWDKSKSRDVTGYSVWYGGMPGDYKTNVFVGKVLTATIDNLPSETPTFFAVTAWSVNLRSDFSNEVRRYAQ